MFPSCLAITERRLEGDCALFVSPLAVAARSATSSTLESLADTTPFWIRLLLVLGGSAQPPPRLAVHSSFAAKASTAMPHHTDIKYNMSCATL